MLGMRAAVLRCPALCNMSGLAMAEPNHAGGLRLPLTFCQRLCMLLQGMEIPDPTGLIPANIENGLSVGTDALVMLGILIGMRIVAYLQMTLAIKFHKL